MRPSSFRTVLHISQSAKPSVFFRVNLTEVGLLSLLCLQDDSLIWGHRALQALKGIASHPVSFEFARAAAAPVASRQLAQAWQAFTEAASRDASSPEHPHTAANSLDLPNDAPSTQAATALEAAAAKATLPKAGTAAKQMNPSDEADDEEVCCLLPPDALVDISVPKCLPFAVKRRHSFQNLILLRLNVNTCSHRYKAPRLSIEVQTEYLFLQQYPSSFDRMQIERNSSLCTGHCVSASTWPQRADLCDAPTATSRSRAASTSKRSVQLRTNGSCICQGQLKYHTLFSPSAATSAGAAATTPYLTALAF